MSMIKKEAMDQKINVLLEELGFEKCILNDKKMYKYHQSYYKLTFLNIFQAYVIEYALTLEESENNWFEDGDLYPISLQEQFIDTLRSDLLKYYIR